MFCDLYHYLSDLSSFNIALHPLWLTTLSWLFVVGLTGASWQLHRKSVLISDMRRQMRRIGRCQCELFGFHIWVRVRVRASTSQHAAALHTGHVLFTFSHLAMHLHVDKMIPQTAWGRLRVASDSPCMEHMIALQIASLLPRFHITDTYTTALCAHTNSRKG